MKPYVEQEGAFFDGRNRNFTIRLFCQGTYDFQATDLAGKPVTTIRALDIDFVHAQVQVMRGWKDETEVQAHDDVLREVSGD